MSWLTPLVPFLPILNAVVGILLAKVLSTPKAHERAAQIATIAADCAALALATLPAGSPYSTIIDWVVQRLKDAGLTANETVLKQAAAGALARLGVKA